MEGYLTAFNDAWKHHRVTFEKVQSHALLLNELYEESPQCRYCHICEKLCPWEAIAIIEEDGHAVLAHHDVLCARCGLCIDICPEKGLLWDRGLTRENIANPHWRMLQQGVAKTCSVCGETFYPTTDNQDVCLICKNKI